MTKKQLIALAEALACAVCFACIGIVLGMGV